MKQRKNSFQGTYHSHQQNQPQRTLLDLFQSGEYEQLKTEIAKLSIKLPLLEQQIKQKERQPKKQQEKIDALYDAYRAAKKLIEKLCTSKDGHDSSAKRIIVDLDQRLAA